MCCLGLTSPEDCDPSFCRHSDVCKDRMLCPSDNINQNCKTFAAENIDSNITSDKDESLRIVNNVCSKDLRILYVQKKIFL